MCRIFGIISHYKSENQVDGFLKDFDQLLHHGGPDASGKYIFEDQGRILGLGHRRLSIIDLSEHGAQPMFDINKQVVISFNGEIYNYREIKNKLSNLGYKFESQTDTEVIINAFLEWGTASFDILEGIFAFSLLDKRTNQFYLVRDRFGVKPLYYYHKNRELIFSSELSPFYTIDGIAENPKWKPLFLVFGHLPEPTTTLNEVYILPKGNFLEYNLNTNAVNVKTYLTKSERKIISDPVIAKRTIREALTNSLESQLMSDVPVALFLSGGIDSSLLTLLASKTKFRDIYTISLDYHEQKYSEKYFQDLITKQSGIKNHCLIVKDSYFYENLPNILDSYDQPSVDGINSWIVSKFTSSFGIKVALSGIGADELFGGYPSFTNYKFVKMMDYIPSFIKSQYKYLPEGKYKRLQYKKINDSLGDYLLFRGNFSLDTVAEILDGSSDEITRMLKDYFINDQTKNLSGHNYIQWMESNLYMQNQLLKDTDFMSMRHGLEVRVPFLDRELVNVVNSIDNSVWQSQQFMKQLLVDSFGELLPKQIWNRPKQGFGLPFNDWMKNEIVIGELSVHPNKKIRTLVKLFKEGKMEWPRLWSLYLLENFRRGKSNL